MTNDNYFRINPLAAQKAARAYTLAQYLKQEERAQTLNEYYNGVIIQCPVRPAPCNIIAANLIVELMTFFWANNKKYLALGSKQLIYLPNSNFCLYPDISVVAETLECKDKKEMLLTNPLLIVEVLSTNSSNFGRTCKFDEYKTLPSFKEYVLIDPNQCRIETRFQDAPNIWRDTIYKNLSDSVKLESIDCEINAHFIYENITFKKSK
jgi:Uma2 family endonuclease